MKTPIIIKIILLDIFFFDLPFINALLKIHEEYNNISLVSQYTENALLRMVIIIYYFKFGAITVHLDQHNYNLLSLATWQTKPLAN